MHPEQYLALHRERVRDLRADAVADRPASTAPARSTDMRAWLARWRPVAAPRRPVVVACATPVCCPA